MYGRAVYVYIVDWNKRKYWSTTFSFVRYKCEHEMQRPTARANNEKIDDKIIQVSRVYTPLEACQLPPKFLMLQRTNMNNQARENYQGQQNKEVLLGRYPFKSIDGVAPQGDSRVNRPTHKLPFPSPLPTRVNSRSR